MEIEIERRNERQGDEIRSKTVKLLNLMQILRLLLYHHIYSPSFSSLDYASLAPYNMNKSLFLKNNNKNILDEFLILM